MAKHSEKNTDKPQPTNAKRARKADDLDEDIEEGVEELAATFNAGPKAAPPPDDPAEGNQYAPG